MGKSWMPIDPGKSTASLTCGEGGPRGTRTHNQRIKSQFWLNSPENYIDPVLAASTRNLAGISPSLF